MAKRKKTPYAKGRGKCIFCGAYGVSREHIWANWLNQYIPRVMKQHKMVSFLVFPDRQKNEETINARTGDPHSRRVRIACKKCNSGWMSRLQKKSKPFLIPLLKGESISFYKNGQTALSAWIAMFVMVAEFLDKEKISISSRERTWFMNKQRPPSHWRIWIGKYEELNVVERWYHNVLAFAKDKDEAVADGTVPSPNTQTSTILLGEHLVIHVMSSLIARRIIKRWQHPPDIANKMRQIWPVTDRIVSWPPDGIMTRDDIETMAYHFFQRCDAVVRKREGMT